MIKKLKTPITYYGGKQKLASAITELIPKHWLYCEPFSGGAAVFFAKEKSGVEVLNDLNKMVINFYSEMKSNFNQLNELIQATPMSRASHEDAWVMYNHPHLFTNLQRAWAFYTLTQQGYSGKISSSWGYGLKKPSSELRLKNKKDDFQKQYIGRLDGVQLECRDALWLIENRDREDTFFYIDPPYFNSNCGHYSGYSERDFEDLLKVLSSLKGKFILSSYPSGILQTYTNSNKWYSISFEQNISVSKLGKRKVEVLTMNFVPPPT